MKKTKKYLIIGIEIFLALMHVVGIGRNSNERMFSSSPSYFFDQALPFGFYFLLVLSEYKVAFLQKWWVKVGIEFLIAALEEVGLCYGSYILEWIFTPIDTSVYAAGSY